MTLPESPEDYLEDDQEVVDPESDDVDVQVEGDGVDVVPWRQSGDRPGEDPDA